MSNKSERLGRLLRQARLRKGLGVREVARAIEVAPMTITRLEQGLIEEPRAGKLARLAQLLEVDLSDAYTTVGYVAPQALPELPAYLRAKHPELGERGIRRLERLFAELRDTEKPARKGGRRG
jgi:transcriptional regulator with XRE-family HTH domain